MVQDYALVIASGDGTLTDALTMTDSPIEAVAAPVIAGDHESVRSWDPMKVRFSRANESVPRPPCRAPTQSRSPPSTVPSPLPAPTNGTSTSDNDLGYTNAAFLTFLARRLSLDSVDISDLAASGGSAPEADINLYVSMDPSLTNLDPDAIGDADTSLGRGGTESIVYPMPSLGFITFG